MRQSLLLFMSIVAITALGSGMLMLYEPDGSLLNLSTRLLIHTPFKNFFLPGLLLTVVVGGVNFFALALTVANHPHAYRFSLVGGIAVLGWIAIQFMILPFYHWLQLLFVAIGLLIALLSYQLMGKAAF